MSDLRHEFQVVIWINWLGWIYRDAMDKYRDREIDLNWGTIKNEHIIPPIQCA